jgi:glycine betaine catabolism B
MKLTLTNKVADFPDVQSFHFKPDSEFQFIPGQFLKYTLPHDDPDDRGITRFYTIASAPSENEIRITTRFAEKSSTFKIALRKLNVGDTIEATGPFGSFTYTDPNQNAVFIAGGIGITPFRSILLEMDTKRANPNVTLLYATRNEDILFKELFESIADKNPKIKLVYILEKPQDSWKGDKGFITADIIKKYVPDLTIPVFYISGPKPMVDIFTTMLTDMNVSMDNIKQDFFPGYTNSL